MRMCADIPAPSLIDTLASITGPKGLLTDAHDMAPYTTDWRGQFRGDAIAVARPANAPEVAAVVKACAAAGVGVVPQGGNTSLSGAAVPVAQVPQIVLSLSRLNQVRAIDPVDLTMTLEPGVTLKAAQQAALDAGCLLPLSISSEGTAQIGGVLGTNAGGNNTLRFGNARDLVLGLEVVTADGQIWNGLRRLRKDNTGYCLRHLFIGSEGTLGIITAAVLKLAPRPSETAVAFCAVESPRAALALLNRLQHADGQALMAFELMSHQGVALVVQHVPGIAMPLGKPSPYYVLVELATSRPQAGLRAGLEDVLGAAMEAGEVTDATFAESEAQRSALWKLREEHAEGLKREGGSIKNDVSVPVSAVPQLIEEGIAAAQAVIPGLRPVPFGHMGDGNIHFNFVAPAGTAPKAMLTREYEVMDAVNAVVRRLDGSFSAEHGIGQFKLPMMEPWRGGTELDIMRRVKAALDPKDTLNPGKMIP